MEEREAKDIINDFGRPPVGEGKEQRVRFLSRFSLNEIIFKSQFQAYNMKLKTLLDDGQDDVPRTAEIGENKEGRIPNTRERIKLEDLTRYTMVKRIW